MRFVATMRAVATWLSRLGKQADAWHKAERIRRYCDAVDAAYGDRPGTAEWVAWAPAYAARLDPLTDPPTTPRAPNVTPEALQQHLPDGWSAHGPEHGRDRHRAFSGRIRP